jgi:membrane protease YdiL (CAAX protease family)
MINSALLKIVGKEIAWFALAILLSYMMMYCLYLLIEALGFAVSSAAPAAVGGMTPMGLLVSLFAQDLAFLLCAAQRIKNERESIDDWKSSAPQISLPQKIGLGVFAALVLLVAVYLQEAVLSLFFDPNELMKSYWEGARNFNPEEKTFLFFFMVISGPVVEELYFREAMLGSIWRAGFSRFAEIFSCQVFGVIKLDFLHIFAYVIYAAGLSLLYLKTKSAAVPIFAHVATNCLVYFMLFVN